MMGSKVFIPSFNNVETKKIQNAKCWMSVEDGVNDERHKICQRRE